MGIALVQQEKRRIVVAAKEIVFSYKDELKQTIVKKVSFNIYHNELICIIGSNGSGKSTLAKIIGGILRPQSGTVTIDGIIIKHITLRQIRQKIGIIFQNPENQFIGTTVYDDIAFGLQNYNVATEKQRGIIHNVTRRLKIFDLLNKEPHELSGGQKQMVAVASVFVLKPEIIIFDESTSMIDADGKRKITELMKLLKTKYKKTIISITHCMEDTVDADRVLVINHGKKKFFLPPKQLFLKHSTELKKIQLDIPPALKISTAISQMKRTINMNECITQFNVLFPLDKQANWNQFMLTEAQRKKMRRVSGQNKLDLHESQNHRISPPTSELIGKSKSRIAKKSLIKVKNYTLTYNHKTASRVCALRNLSCQFTENNINVIVGGAGAGKSTLFQVIDFLIRGQVGHVEFNFSEKEQFLLTMRKVPFLNKHRCKSNTFRRNLGLVFQFPEYQLFNLTVLKEVLFSYFNFRTTNADDFWKLIWTEIKTLSKWKSWLAKKKYSSKEVDMVRKLLQVVQLDEKYLLHNPLELSGGQKRKIAIASVLAHSPNVIMFDEPTAGLDPMSAKNILCLIKRLQSHEHKTIILITHDMDLALEVGDNMTVLRNGKLVAQGTCQEIFTNHKIMTKCKMELPQTIQIINMLGLAPLLKQQKLDIFTVDNLCHYLRCLQI